MNTTLAMIVSQGVSLYFQLQKEVALSIGGLICLWISVKMAVNEVLFIKRLVENDRGCKEKRTSLLSYFSFGYIDQLIAIGLHEPLKEDELDELLPENIVSRFKFNPKYSLLMNLYFSIWFIFSMQQLTTFISISTTLSGPLFLNLILEYVSAPTESNMPWVYAVSMFACAMIRSFADGQTYFLGRRMGIRVRSVIISLVYNKSLKKIKYNEKDTGKIMNLMSVDSAKILEVCCYLMYLWSTPLQIVIIIAYLLYIAGWAGAIGLAVMVAMLLFTGLAGRLIVTTQTNLMKKSDARITSAHELLQSIRRFQQKLFELRKTELGALWDFLLTSNAYKIMMISTPILVSFVTFTAITYSGKPLSVSTAFTCLSIFQTLQRPMYVIPDIIVKVLEAYVSLKRVEDYLTESELEEYVNVNGYSPLDPVVCLPNSEFQYPGPSTGLGFAEVDSTSGFKLRNLDIKFPINGLTVIHGTTGSGKTSLLNAILGELECNSGGVHLGQCSLLKKDIPIAYASQHVWLKNATIRENITFGTPYDQARYLQVVFACSLVRDLKTLSGGDLTEIGEKGVNLSGGQKARISLARAIYSYCPIILMDDILSAVDAPTAKHILEQAICGPLLKNRTKILATHATSLCLPRADLAIQLSRGKVIQIENPKEEFVGSPVAKPDFDISDFGSQEHGIIVAEGRSKGSISWSVYWAYLSAAGGLAYLFLITISYGSAQIALFSNDYWIKVWADAYTKGNPSLKYYVSVYAGLGALTILVYFARVCVVAAGSIRASKTIHAKLVKKILRVPVKFFEITPVGRILNRLSKDLKDIDVDLAVIVGDFLANLVKLGFYLTIILVLSPTSVIGIFPVVLMYGFIGKRYLVVARELKRIDSNTRSPIFSHFGETIEGASVIRGIGSLTLAYAQEMRFVSELYTKVDENHKAFALIWIMNRWLGVRIDLIGALVSLSSCLSVIAQVKYGGGMDGGYAGLSISYSLDLAGSLLWLVRIHAQMEMEMNAVERVEEYSQLEEEAPAIIPSNRPPYSWPSEGKIDVQGLSLRYSPEGPNVLSEVTFKVGGGEKIGVVGRTGAGKTTLSLAFFRFMEHAAGRIIIDGVDISSIGLHDLRSKLTVIPQDPVLLSGSLRSNLDPFSEYTDQDIWNCLKLVHFLESCKSSIDTPDIQSENITLESVVTEGGHNFSQGQRQLLCLARAILKQSKVIILDEATASIDHETDLKIQETIRDRFNTSSLLCIAHRLSTIMDYDKILVLDRGQVVQFDTPYNLIKTTGSVLSKKKQYSDSLMYSFLPLLAGVLGQYSINDKAVGVQLFMWKFTEIEKECAWLAENGYSYVQTSPIQPHLNHGYSGDAFNWYYIYQPVSYRIGNRLGNYGEFVSMVKTCKGLGVDVVVDVILNHNACADQSAATSDLIGNITSNYWNGQSFNESFPDAGYTAEHYHDSTCQTADDGRSDWSSWFCRVANLVDLNTAHPLVRQKSANFLNELLSLGVAGFRLDASKNIAYDDWVAILGAVNKNYRGQTPYYGHEIMGPFTGGNYLNYPSLGRILNFDYAAIVGQAFRNIQGRDYTYTTDKLVQKLPSQVLSGEVSTVFVENHDSERDMFGNFEYALSRIEGAFFYKQAIAFNILYPWGLPIVHSGFHFTFSNFGSSPVSPPSDANGYVLPVNIANGQWNASAWDVQHRWGDVYPLVRIRNFIGQGLTSLPPINVYGTNQIYWSVPGKGFVAINSLQGSTQNQDMITPLQTGLAAGTYCNFVYGFASNGRCALWPGTALSNGEQVAYTVDSNGFTKVNIKQSDRSRVVALYAGADGGFNINGNAPSFGTVNIQVHHQAQFGYGVYIVGSHNNWNTCAATPCAWSTGDVWKCSPVQTVVGQSYQWKAIVLNNNDPSSCSSPQWQPEPDNNFVAAGSNQVVTFSY
ncbi:hypothetical protein HDV01_005751 [Terramyces sp. JEL0728]|nr:hypothetical protein HDV01_005751 [Terramyces sp. JEL0728]